MEFNKFYNDYVGKIKKNLDLLNSKDVKKVIDLILEAHRNNRQIIIFGNGGSATTSDHFVCDLGKGSVRDFKDINEERIKAMSLNNLSLITAYGNDLSYEDIFSQQLANLVNENDIVIAISASGNSPNIIKAVELAKEKKAIVIGFCGFEGGKLKVLSDYFVYINENHYGIVEDLHLVIAHIICYYVKELRR